MPLYHVRAFNGPNAFQFNLTAEAVEALVIAHLRAQRAFMFQGRRYDITNSSTFVEVVETAAPIPYDQSVDPMATWRTAWTVGREVSRRS